LEFTFMSAMLTYFVFMLQKRCYRRKDRTKTVVFARTALKDPDRAGSVPFIPGVAQRRKVLEWARKMRHHGGKPAELLNGRGEGGDHGCPIL
jgi:hypothetical protein